MSEEHRNEPCFFSPLWTNSEIVFSLVCTLGNSNIAITIRHCNFESAHIWENTWSPLYRGPNAKDPLVAVQCSRAARLQVSRRKIIWLKCSHIFLQTLYTTTSFVGQVGVFTGMKPNKFTHHSQWERYSIQGSCFLC